MEYEIANMCITFLYSIMIVDWLLMQVVDETDRLLGEAYQSWLPTVLKLARPSDEILAKCADVFSPSFCGSFKTIRRL